MSILDGFKKRKRYTKLSDGNYQLQSEWTSADTVELTSGKTLTQAIDDGDISGLNMVDITEEEYQLLSEEEKQKPILYNRTNATPPASSAGNIFYNNESSNLESTNVQGAIDELNTNLENLENNKLDKKDISDWAKASTKPSYAWTEITNKPSTFTPSSHTHPWSNLYNIPNLIYTLSGAAKIREISIQINESAYMQVVTSSSVAYGVNVWESDTKLKKNIAPTDQTALDKVKQIDFVQFDWKDTDKHVDLGVTANQLETVIPSAVYDVPQGEESEFDSLKNIDTGIMTTYALKAIQELSNIIEKQQQEINTLKEKIKYNE